MVDPSFGIDITAILVSLVMVTIFLFILVAAGYAIFIFFRNRNREKGSIDSVLLQVALPRNNEIKIDVMEQLFSSLYSTKKGGW